MNRSQATVDRWTADARTIRDAIDAQIAAAETLYGVLPVTHDARANDLITALMKAREETDRMFAQIHDIPVTPDVVMVKVDAEVWVRWDRRAKAPIDATVTIRTAAPQMIAAPDDRTVIVPEADVQCAAWREFVRAPYRPTPVTGWETTVPPQATITNDIPF